MVNHEKILWLQIMVSSVLSAVLDILHVKAIFEVLYVNFVINVFEFDLYY